jgi:hypothetical protein
VSEKRVLRRIFGPKKEEEKGGWRKLYNKEKDFLGELAVDGGNITLNINEILCKNMKFIHLISRYGSVAGTCEHDNETSRYTRAGGGALLDNLSDYQLLKKALCSMGKILGFLKISLNCFLLHHF